MAAKFALTKAKNGQFIFNLKATNGQTILTSEMYTTKSAALNGIESVKKNEFKSVLDIYYLEYLALNFVFSILPVGFRGTVSNIISRGLLYFGRFFWQ